MITEQFLNIKIKRKKLIRLVKESMLDPTATLNAEQTNAREQLTKLVLSSNFQNSKLNNGFNVDTNFFLADKKMNQSQTLLNGVISQMNYNDIKTQKIKLKKPQIWRIIAEGNVNSYKKVDKHIANVCKEHKFKI